MPKLTVQRLPNDRYVNLSAIVLGQVFKFGQSFYLFLGRDLIFCIGPDVKIPYKATFDNSGTQVIPCTLKEIVVEEP